jgi:hypothetical protein
MIPHHGPAANLLDAALTHHQRGWTVIPVRGKDAAVKWKRYQAGRPDEAQLRRSFEAPGVTGLAVLLGSASGGLHCRDFDIEGNYDCWAAGHIGLARTLPTVATKRGYQVYFAGRADHYSELEDGEYRGDPGHYCVLPPSRHPAGPLYRWQVPLPEGPLPLIDPHEAGLLPVPLPLLNTSSPITLPCNTENTGDGVVCSSVSESSVFSVLHAPGVGQAIRATLPAGEGRRHRALFHLARQLKALPHLAGADPAALKPVVKHWHRLALPVIRTKPFKESWLDFVDAWKRVKFPAGTGPLQALWSRALAEPPPPEVLAYAEEGVRRLVALCFQLQRRAGAGTFFLACRTAQDVLGLDSHVTAWRWLRILQVDGVLVRVSTGSKASRLANEYRYMMRPTGRPAD